MDNSLVRLDKAQKDLVFKLAEHTAAKSRVAALLGEIEKAGFDPNDLDATIADAEGRLKAAEEEVDDLCARIEGILDSK